MTYTIAKGFKIHHDEYGWCFEFLSDEYGTVSVREGDGTETIHIPKDCIQHFIDVLEQFK